MYNGFSILIGCNLCLHFNPQNASQHLTVIMIIVSFFFPQECATLFIDSKDKEVKHAFALMFVEILLPVAAGANRELNVPAIKGFVDQMYHHTFELTKKTRHSQVCDGLRGIIILSFLNYESCSLSTIQYFFFSLKQKLWTIWLGLG